MNVKGLKLPGFTLIELLIVIAVLGVLAAAVLVVINPVEQLARGRDSGRKSSIAQLGRAMQSYYTTQFGYPPAGTWDDELTTVTGEIRTFPQNPSGAIQCSDNPKPNADGYCYDTALVGGTPESVIYSHLESKAENSKCAGVLANTWYAWSSADGKAGVYCNPSAPVPGITGLLP